MASLTLTDVSKKYGRVLAVDRVSISVANAEFLALLGPSGCGKSSTMRMVAGLETITSGAIHIDGQQVNDLPPADRQTAMSFENYGLYPHMTIFQNIAYPLRIRGISVPQIEIEVVKIARLLQIEDLLDSKPREVSGGVQQRVSLARALVRKPSVFLLDEPLSHLDADLRSQMRAELKRLQKLGDGSTMIYVTHDQLEAMTMADRIAVMNQGRLQQVGTPREVFHSPANRFVASFIGEPPMNLMSGRVERSDDGYRISVHGHPFAELQGSVASALTGAGLPPEGQLEVGVRPADLELHSPGSAGLPVQVRVREFLGENAMVTLDAMGTKFRVVGRRDTMPAEGDAAVLRARPDRVHLFSSETGEAFGGNRPH
jgi:ABC-type sugar transport system ATPase subunit